MYKDADRPNDELQPVTSNSTPAIQNSAKEDVFNAFNTHSILPFAIPRKSARS